MYNCDRKRKCYWKTKGLVASNGCLEAGRNIPQENLHHYGSKPFFINFTILNNILEANWSNFSRKELGFFSKYLS